VGKTPDDQEEEAPRDCEPEATIRERAGEQRKCTGTAELGGGGVFSLRRVRTRQG